VRIDYIIKELDIKSKPLFWPSSHPTSIQYILYHSHRSSGPDTNTYKQNRKYNQMRSGFEALDLCISHRLDFQSVWYKPRFGFGFGLCVPVDECIH
jgi:hypothetical protein